MVGEARFILRLNHSLDRNLAGLLNALAPCSAARWEGVCKCGVQGEEAQDGGPQQGRQQQQAQQQRQRQQQWEGGWAGQRFEVKQPGGCAASSPCE